jgi:hypothetical protein
MSENIVLEYINYVKKSIYNFYRILLDKKYSYSLVSPIITKYIKIRYYNDTDSKEKNIIKRINKELKVVVTESLNDNPNNADLIKNVYALVSYLLYIDDVVYYDNLNTLIDTLISDDIITLTYTEDTINKFKDFIKAFEQKKNEYFDIFMTSNFSITEKRLRAKVYDVILEQNCRISKLYSEYAINKAFTSGLVNEDKCFITYSLTAVTVLKNAISSDFSRDYLVNLPSTLFTKEHKINRILNTLNNDLTKEHIYLKITYHDYQENKEIVNKYLKDGYHFALILDDTYQNDFDELILFSYIILYDYLDCYDMIMNDKDKIKATIIAL